MYYSEISKSWVSESEALKQIIDLCNQWYQIAQPSESLYLYLMNHPNLLEISQWNCFITK